MHIIPQSFNIIEYCIAMERKEIVVNRKYQRSDAVWPDAAQSFLIETILLGYPMPKLSLYQVTDIKSRKTHKEIVDGQQRSQVVFNFYKDGFRLGRSLQSEHLKGKRFSDLDEDLQAVFLSYAIPIDLFVSATPDEIREVFRRMNSYTVPLNPEEQRHAAFQGDFKWFIYQLCSQYDESLKEMGVFGEKQLVRMADAKLYSEVAHAFLHGITTTNKMKLDALYRSRDKEFPEESELSRRFHQALTTLIELTNIHQSILMKPYIIYSLLIAISHMKSPLGTLNRAYRAPRDYRLLKRPVLSNLSLLEEALNNPDDAGDFEEFVQACAERTNVAEQREIRFKWLCQALEPRAF